MTDDDYTEPDASLIDADGLAGPPTADGRVAVEVLLQLEERASGEETVDVSPSDGLGVGVSAAVEVVIGLDDRARRFGDAVSDGLFARSRLGRRARVGGHTRAMLGLTEKSSARMEPDSTTQGRIGGIA